jgi:hypothetical protein
MTDEFIDEEDALTPPVVEETPAPAFVPEEPVAEEEEEEVVVTPPAPAPVEEVKSKNEDEAPAAEDAKVVSLSALKEAHKRFHTKNSRSVRLIQKQLVDAGFFDAGSDNFGEFGKGTEDALRQFCGCEEEVCHIFDAELHTRLFSGSTVQVTE